jgi:hypothetical protein
VETKEIRQVVSDLVEQILNNRHMFACWLLRMLLDFFARPWLSWFCFTEVSAPTSSKSTMQQQSREMSKRPEKAVFHDLRGFAFDVVDISPRLASSLHAVGEVLTRAL